MTSHTFIVGIRPKFLQYPLFPCTYKQLLPTPFYYRSQFPKNKYTFRPIRQKPRADDRSRLEGYDKTPSCRLRKFWCVVSFCVPDLLHSWVFFSHLRLSEGRSTESRYELKLAWKMLVVIIAARSRVKKYMDSEESNGSFLYVGQH